MSDDFDAITGDLGDFGKEAEYKERLAVSVPMTFTFGELAEMTARVEAENKEGKYDYLAGLGLLLLTDLIGVALQYGFCPKHNAFGDHPEQHQADEDDG